MYQRRMALSGDDWQECERDEKEENRQMEAFKQEVHEYVPEIFGYSTSTPTFIVPADW
jgi:mediator of RNA polymerase II transcription subunit 12